MPAPVPVPRMAAKTTGAPAPAPSVASDSARQLASFINTTRWPTALSTSACSGRPFRQVELQFFINPAAVAVPGVPMPMLSAPPTAASDTARAVSVIAAMARTVAL